MRRLASVEMVSPQRNGGARGTGGGGAPGDGATGPGPAPGLSPGLDPDLSPDLSPGRGAGLGSALVGDPRPSGAGPQREVSRLWHITLSVAGEEAPLREVRQGLEQLAHDHPFLLTSRYANDHAEIRYWEEARDLHDAAAVALRLWGEHRASASLPPWEIVGLEVVGRETYHQRIEEGYGLAPATPVGVHPF